MAGAAFPPSSAPTRTGPEGRMAGSTKSETLATSLHSASGVDNGDGRVGLAAAVRCAEADDRGGFATLSGQAQGDSREWLLRAARGAALGEEEGWLEVVVRAVPLTTRKRPAMNSSSRTVPASTSARGRQVEKTIGRFMAQEHVSVSRQRGRGNWSLQEVRSGRALPL